ncbi:permease of the major facilitator superfamily [Vibrio variabilis]|uniref:Permease of the major facilitator superfamily n=1 Tax=Vibrio variabilis TaxID=990271 RepID=A0ABQ0J4A6_9VIBR|nr:permease of the major facilitator superfamily [Vibrio variabilis]
MQGLKSLLGAMMNSFKDLMPIVLVVLFFQLVVLQELSLTSSLSCLVCS